MLEKIYKVVLTKNFNLFSGESEAKREEIYTNYGCATMNFLKYSSFGNDIEPGVYDTVHLEVGEICNNNLSTYHPVRIAREETIPM